MDTFDKVDMSYRSPASLLSPSSEGASELIEGTEDAIEGAVETTKSTLRDNWKMILGYAAIGLAVVGGIAGYAYLQSRQKPKSRLQRLRGNLGMERVDFSRLPASLRDVDFDRLNRTGRDIGSYAKKATHNSAKKVVKLTR